MRKRPCSSFSNLEEGSVELVHQIEVLSDCYQLIGYSHKQSQLPDECGGLLGAADEVLKSLSADAPVLADLQAWQAPLFAPPIDSDCFYPQVLGDLFDA
jgi:hypothetical protein